MTRSSARATGTSDATSPGLRAWLRLQVALSATAFAVVLVRTLQLTRLASEPGTIVLWRPILATQGAYWIAWSLWAGLLVPLVRRLVENPPSRVKGIVTLIALAVLPPFIVPIFYSPVHWFLFQRIATVTSAYGHMASHDILTNVLLSATIVGVVYGYLSLQHTRRLEVRASQLSEQLTRAQLDALRAQLNPHFLFNALNSIAVLARRGRTADVEHMVTRLANLLRHSLESSRSQLVTLRVELDAVQHYIEIEKVRYDDRLVVTMDVPDSLLDHVVPSFLLQPLIENAIRHGFTDARTVLHIQVQGTMDERRLTLSVCDDGAGISERDDTRDGVGIGNTRTRLEGLYGSTASLSLSPGTGGRGTLVTVVLPLGTSSARATAPA